MHARNDRNRSTEHDSKRTVDNQDVSSNREWILNAIDEVEDDDDGLEEMLQNDSIGG